MQVGQSVSLLWQSGRTGFAFIHIQIKSSVREREVNLVEDSLQKLETSKWIKSGMSVKLDLFRNLVDHNWQLWGQAFRWIHPIVREPLLCWIVEAPSLCLNRIQEATITQCNKAIGMLGCGPYKNACKHSAGYLPGPNGRGERQHRIRLANGRAGEGTAPSF